MFDGLFCRDELFASLFDKKPEYKVISEDQEPADVVILRWAEMLLYVTVVN